MTFNAFLNFPSAPDASSTPGAVAATSWAEPLRAVASAQVLAL